MEYLQYSTVVLIIVATVMLTLLARNPIFRRLRVRAHGGPLADSLDSEHEAAVDRPLGRGKAVKDPSHALQRSILRPLSNLERGRFRGLWVTAQAQFMDSPLAAVLEADRVVTEVIRARGYPIAGFDERAANLNVAHPRLVHSYHMAHDLALKGHRGRATTEDLRQSMIHYRMMVEELVTSVIEEDAVEGSLV